MSCRPATATFSRHRCRDAASGCGWSAASTSLPSTTTARRSSGERRPSSVASPPRDDRFPQARSPMSDLGREDVAHVARLARLELTEDELDRFTVQLVSVLDHASDIAALDLSGLEPMSHPLEIRPVLRPDNPPPPLDRAAVLAAAPAVEDDRFRVPRIVAEPG